MDTRLTIWITMAQIYPPKASHQKRLECFAKKTPEQFMNFFDEVEEAFRYFIRSNPALTEEQFKFIYSIRRALKEV